MTPTTMTTEEELAAQSLPPAPEDERITSAALREEIKRIEASLTAEFEKPVEQRDLQQLMGSFQPIADQEQDAEAKLYAEKRIEQLRRAQVRMEMIMKIRELNRKMDEERQRFQNERSQITPPPLPLEREFAARGKLVKSYAYTQPVSGKERYRLIDVSSPDQRTIAYVEIEPDSGIAAENYLGRYVGVRAKGQVLLEGSIDPVLVYTVAELVILEQPRSDTTPQE